MSFYNEVGSTDVVADVVAYFDPAVGSKFTPLATPSRVLDDRVQNGLSGPWQVDQTRTLPIVGRAAIPQGATGVVMNTTATNGSAGSFVTVFPSGTVLPNVSQLYSSAPARPSPTLVVAQLPPNGALDIYNKVGTVDIVGDAVGYFAPPTGDVIPPDPASVAPPLDPETVTDLPSSTAFLYTGPNPVQTLVTPGAIDPVNATVVRGRRRRPGRLADLGGARGSLPTIPSSAARRRALMRCSTSWSTAGRAWSCSSRSRGSSSCSATRRTPPARS